MVKTEPASPRADPGGLRDTLTRKVSPPEREGVAYFRFEIILLCQHLILSLSRWPSSLILDQRPDLCELIRGLTTRVGGHISDMYNRGKTALAYNKTLAGYFVLLVSLRPPKLQIIPL